MKITTLLLLIFKLIDKLFKYSLIICFLSLFIIIFIYYIGLLFDIHIINTIYCIDKILSDLLGNVKDITMNLFKSYNLKELIKNTEIIIPENFIIKYKYLIDDRIIIILTLIITGIIINMLIQGILANTFKFKRINIYCILSSTLAFNLNKINNNPKSFESLEYSEIYKHLESELLNLQEHNIDITNFIASVNEHYDINDPLDGLFFATIILLVCGLISLFYLTLLTIILDFKLQNNSFVLKRPFLIKLVTSYIKSNIFFRYVFILLIGISIIFSLIFITFLRTYLK